MLVLFSFFFLFFSFLKKSLSARLEALSGGWQVKSPNKSARHYQHTQKEREEENLTFFHTHTHEYLVDDGSSCATHQEREGGKSNCQIVNAACKPAGNRMGDQTLIMRNYPHHIQQARMNNSPIERAFFFCSSAFYDDRRPDI